MLVLSRRIGETIKIGDDIEIHILDVNYGQVRVGLDAPKDVNIVRSELLGRPREPKTETTKRPTPAGSTSTIDRRPTLTRSRSY